MSSSEIVINFRFGPFVREIRNILLEGVTGITTWTDASVPFTNSKNFCFPSSISSIVFFPLPRGNRFVSKRGGGVSPNAEIDRPLIPLNDPSKLARYLFRGGG
jgi:hypothetical protein